MLPYVGRIKRFWLTLFLITFQFNKAHSFVDITHFDLVERPLQPWLYSGKYQGDIDVDSSLLREPDEFVYFNAVKNREQTWPNGEIPYVIDSAFYLELRSQIESQFSQNLSILAFSERHLIRAAFTSFHNRTCIRFRHKRRYEQDYLNIVRGKGCYSQIGRTGGKQEISLGLGCHHHETIVHELMHSVGFWHEHSRADRDDHVQINWANIIPGAKSQFDKIPRFIQDLLDEPYDYFSVMHYEATAFATNARYSIESKDEKLTDLMGTGTDLSYGDIRKINKLYNCQMMGKDEKISKFRQILELGSRKIEKSVEIETTEEKKLTIEPDEYEPQDPEEILRIVEIE
ncbi:unnamed protein product, partial [Mesorhabditis belari]|uniref:Metalloendopeptidase n=1 Tax=Mesorhabditis belari TaxID=2138241 RepID=A0AAF3J4W5_9BILA